MMGLMLVAVDIWRFLKRMKGYAFFMPSLIYLEEKKQYTSLGWKVEYI